jgi:dTDP-4-dehydrorhamnose 3,5-epimerase
MLIKETNLLGCYCIYPDIYKDDRGQFVKTIDGREYEKYGLNYDFCEEYYSKSIGGVLRGMHFQLPPYDHSKLVCCFEGRVMDVVLDLRLKSPTYGKHQVFNLDSDNPVLIYIPKGMAHGFYTISEQATMLYKTTSLYQPDHESGILWSSIGVLWPEKNPILSKRDTSFQNMSDFKTIF